MTKIDSIETNYRIYVTTTNLPNASLSANVFLQIFGKRRIEKKSGKIHDLWSTKFPLQKTQSKCKKFQAGKTDIFEIVEVDVGKLKKIRISHDGLSSWHLKKVVIEMPSLNRYWAFKCNQWIGKFKRDNIYPKLFTNLIKSFKGPMNNKSEMDLFPSKDAYEDSDSSNERDVRQEKILTKIRYDIQVKTSDFSDNGESINLKLIGAGKGNESGLIRLNNTPSDNEKAKFLKDSLDVFKVEELDIGSVKEFILFF